MEYSLLKLLVESMEERLNDVKSAVNRNNEYYAALCEFINAAQKLMRFF